MENNEFTIRGPAGLGIENLIRPEVHSSTDRVDLEDEKRKQTARDFESIFLHRLFSAMQQTIPESDLEDSSSGQIKSMYWSFMAQAVADQGGLGLWKQVYEQMPKTDGASSPESNEAETWKLDESV
ncbi:MAG: rod-binding protein [Sedimentisphaerales bacterium]|nr:rod-binding protein [Sedimentisphaerales bacterium]